MSSRSRSCPSASCGRPSRAILLVVVAAVWLAVLTGSRPAHAGDSSRVWRTLETTHFVITYYQPNEDLARRLAVVAERAHAILAPVLAHQPREKTQVVVTDDTDASNGYAMTAPRNLIWLYATAPTGDSALNDHDDWLYLLFAHEYTHVLHLDTVGGLPAIYNRVFGKYWMPNQIQPRWVVEGIATYEESKRSASGRTRNAIFDMYLRMAVLEHRPLDLDAVSSVPRRYPQGNTPYLYGSHFVKYVADRYGDDFVRKLSHSYGRQMIPWNFGAMVRRATGRNFDELYAEWREELTRKYALEKAAVERRGAIEGRRLTFSAQGNGNPVYTRDGQRIVWIRSDGRSRSGYRIMPASADASAGRDLALIDGAGLFSFVPDGSAIVFERSESFRTNYDWMDLWRYDFATKRLSRLTWGQRASTPDVSPDGRQVAFTLNGRSKMKLAIMPLRAGVAPEVVWEGPDRFDQAMMPVWSPDGRQLAFSAWTTGGYRDIYVLDLATRQARPLTHDRALEFNPHWAPDGRRVFFTSDRSGIYNLYAADVATGELRQVTNVLGGVFDFDLSPTGDRVVYQGFVSDGYEIYELPLDESRWLVPEPYLNDRPEVAAIADDPDAIVTGPRPYRPLETLAPRYWTGSYVLGSVAESSITLQTNGSDVVGIHSYALAATLTGEGDVTFGASYSYGRFWPSLSAGVSRGIGEPGGLILDGANTRYHNESWGGRVGVGLPVLRRPGISADLGFAYNLGWTRNVDPAPVQDPNASLSKIPEMGVAAGVTTRWSLSSVRSYLFSTGPREGRNLVLNVRFNHPSLGSDTEALEVYWSWEEYFPMPWRGGHTMSLRYAGGIENTTSRRDGVYVLGGQVSQDIVSAIVNSTRVSGSGSLRGFPAGVAVGRQYHLANFEYRVPIRVFEKGYGTFPLYIRRLHAAGLADVGNAFYGELDPTKLRVALGAALRLEATFGFFVGGTFEVGYARGLTDGGVGETWLLLTQGI